MTNRKLHRGEVDIDLALVHELLAAQYPEWSNLPLSEVRSTGTVNAMFRLGDDMCVRLPRTEASAPRLSNELNWLPRLAPQLPLRIPHPVASGNPDAGYPFPWAVYSWTAGETYIDQRVNNEGDAAVTLAGFILALRDIDVSNAPPSDRTEPIVEDDAFTLSSIESLPTSIDQAVVRDAWSDALQAPPFKGTSRWIHGDLIPPNVLVRDGQIVAVLDFGDVGKGDPAFDVIAAWSLFGPEGRRRFRIELGVDDSTWARARGLALRQAIRIVPYYWESHRDFAEMAAETIRRVIEDLVEAKQPRSQSE